MNNKMMKQSGHDIKSPGCFFEEMVVSVINPLGAVMKYLMAQSHYKHVKNRRLTLTLEIVKKECMFHF